MKTLPTFRPALQMQIFRSIRFNIVLFCVIAAACAAGTFIPQLAETPERVEAFIRAHAFWGPLFQNLDLFNVYYSPWFRSLLALMAFDILVCKLYDKPPDPGLVRLSEEEDATPTSDVENILALKSYHASFGSELSSPAAEERSRAWLKGRGYALGPSSNGGRRLAVGTRHRLQRWGSYLSHVSLVVLLLGAFVKSLFGFEEMLPILEGRSKQMEHLPIDVKLDKFEIAYYPGTREPRRFASDLRVYRLEKHPEVGPEPFEEEKLIGSKRILVNDPFEIPMDRWGLTKTKLYQATWGAGGMFRSVTLALGDRRLQLPQRAWTPVGRTGFAVQADLLFPDFSVGADGRPGNASLDLRNPAVRFMFRRGRRLSPPLWLFESWPELCFEERPDGTLVHAPSPPFHMLALDPMLFSGIQAAYDPGFPLLILGAVGMLAGLCLLFYLHRRRLWVLLIPSGAGCRVRLAGFSSRGSLEFKPEFDQAVDELREVLGGTARLPVSMPSQEN